MKINLPKNLILLAQNLDKPLYVVGGAVRNYLINGTLLGDVDLCAPMDSDNFKRAVIDCGFKVVAEYKHMGTVLFSDGQDSYEFTSFRKESYVKGEHKPLRTEFVEDIKEDALRRDFKCNAIYYDIAREKIVDPLDGVEDVYNKVLDTVTDAQITFSRDGLRLMRLARFAGELDFTPTVQVIDAATRFADNILDISPERVYAELKMILVADKKYEFSNENGHYEALKILDKTRVLDRIFPDLTQGRGMAQRADFHKYDVLEHSLRCALYSPPEIRLGALLHDIGKPLCFKRDGYYYHHFSVGEKLAEQALKKLRVDKKTINGVKYLVKEHMVDLDCSMKENKVKRFIIKNFDRINELLMVKQADFRASLEADYDSPTVVKWKNVIKKMQEDNTPMTLKQLDVSAGDLIEIGFKNEQIKKESNALWEFAINNPKNNNRKILLEKAQKDFYKLMK